MSEQSDLAKVLKKAYRKMTDAEASAAAKLVLDNLAEARKKRWQLVEVAADMKGGNPMKKSDFNSILKVFIAGNWVGFMKPDTQEVQVATIGPLKK